jgi:hypothetical protein
MALKKMTRDIRLPVVLGTMISVGMLAAGSPRIAVAQTPQQQVVPFDAAVPQQAMPPGLMLGPAGRFAPVPDITLTSEGKKASDATPISPPLMSSPDRRLVPGPSPAISSGAAGSGETKVPPSLMPGPNGRLVPSPVTGNSTSPQETIQSSDGASPSTTSRQASVVSPNVPPALFRGPDGRMVPMPQSPGLGSAAAPPVVPEPLLRSFGK